MNSLVMIILAILLKHIFNLLDRRQNQAVKTFGFYEAFRVGVQVWAFMFLYHKSPSLC